MKINKKKLVLLILIIIIVIITVICIYNKSNNNKKTNEMSNIEKNTISNQTIPELIEINNNRPFFKQKEFYGFKLSDIRLMDNENKVILLATITNVSKKDIQDYTYVKIIFLNEKNEETHTIHGIINPINKNETTQLKASINGNTQDYINAYDFKLVID